MPVNIRGRHFLKLIDYTPAEIRYLLDLSHNFKDLKRAGTPHRYLEGRILSCCLKKPRPARAARSKSPGVTWAWA